MRLTAVSNLALLAAAVLFGVLVAIIARHVDQLAADVEHECDEDERLLYREGGGTVIPIDRHGT